jgi:hypothetical protein
VGTRGKFGDYATETLMDGILRRNDVGEDRSIGGQDRGGSFVTRGFDTQDRT